jgi:hypothetical protein
METLKKYLPFIIIGVVILFLLRRMSSGTQTRFLPQTQFTEVQQINPLDDIRRQHLELHKQRQIQE